MATHIGIVSGQRTRLDLVFGWAEWDPSDQVTVGDRLVPRVIEVVAPGSSDGDDPALRLEIRMIDGVPRCSVVEIKMRDGRRGVLARDLRDVRLDDWTEEIVAAASSRIVSVEDGPDDSHVVTSAIGQGREWDASAKRAVRAMQRGGRRTVTPTHLNRVAQIYRDHDEKPVQAVQFAFGTSYRTASRWVQKAREEGLL